MDSSTSTESARPPRRGPSRLYLFCLTTACTFFLGVMVLGGMLAVHEASTSVVLRVADLGLVDLTPEAVQREVMDPQQLSATLAKVGLDERAKALVHATAQADDAGDIRVVIGYTDANAQRAGILVNELAEKCVARHRGRMEQQLRQVLSAAREKIQKAQEQKFRLDDEISRFLEEVVQKTMHVSVNTWESDPFRQRLRKLSAPQPVAGEGTMLASAEADELDPREVQREIAERELHLQQLLASRTPAHPEVQLVKLDIEKLKAVLLNLPAVSAAKPHPPADKEPLPRGASQVPRAAPASTTLTEAQAQASLQLKRYHERFQQLNEVHQSLAQAERHVWERYRDLDHSPIGQTADAQQTMRLDGPRWRRFTALMALLSTMVGGVMVMAARRGDVAFFSADQARRELPVPVLGSLAHDKSLRLSPGRLANRIHRVGKTTCEWVVGALVLWLLMLCLLDSTFLGAFFSDPLAAVALAWQRTWG